MLASTALPLPAAPPPSACSLELSGWTNNLTSPLPFAATAARGLRRLTINCPAPWLDGMECWADLEWKLHCFPRLEVGGVPAWQRCCMRCCMCSQQRVAVAERPHGPRPPPFFLRPHCS